MSECKNFKSRKDKPCFPKLVSSHGKDDVIAENVNFSSATKARNYKQNYTASNKKNNEGHLSRSVSASESYHNQYPSDKLFYTKTLATPMKIEATDFPNQKHNFNNAHQLKVNHAQISSQDQSIKSGDRFSGNKNFLRKQSKKNEAKEEKGLLANLILNKEKPVTIHDVNSTVANKQEKYFNSNQDFLKLTQSVIRSKTESSFCKIVQPQVEQRKVKSSVSPRNKNLEVATQNRCHLERRFYTLVETYLDTEWKRARNVRLLKSAHQIKSNYEQEKIRESRRKTLAKEQSSKRQREQLFYVRNKHLMAKERRVTSQHVKWKFIEREVDDRSKYGLPDRL